MDMILRRLKATESLRRIMSNYYLRFNDEYSAVYSWSYGVANDSDHPIVVTLDLGESQNMSFSTKGASAKKLLQPREIWFMLHAQAGYGDFGKAVKHEA